MLVKGKAVDPRGVFEEMGVNDFYEGNDRIGMSIEFMERLGRVGS